MEIIRWCGAGVAVALVVGLVGTAPVRAQSPNSTMSREVISATGCVGLAAEDGQGEGLGTALVLKGVRIAPAAGLVEARAGGADLVRRDTGLLLVADRGVDLASHVGHRVLVTGRLSSFAAPGGVASTSSGQTLTVTTVSLIAPACTTGS